LEYKIDIEVDPEDVNWFALLGYSVMEGLYENASEPSGSINAGNTFLLNNHQLSKEESHQEFSYHL
jgi:hypothetical protein